MSHLLITFLCDFEVQDLDVIEVLLVGAFLSRPFNVERCG